MYKTLEPRIESNDTTGNSFSKETTKAFCGCVSGTPGTPGTDIDYITNCCEAKGGDTYNCGSSAYNWANAEGDYPQCSPAPPPGGGCGDCSNDTSPSCCDLQSRGCRLRQCAKGCVDDNEVGECVRDGGGGGETTHPCKCGEDNCDICWSNTGGVDMKGGCGMESDCKTGPCWPSSQIDDDNEKSQRACEAHHGGGVPGPGPVPGPGHLVPPPDWSGSAGLHFYNYLKNKLLTDFSVNYPKMTDKVKVVSCLLNNFCKGNNPKKVMSLLLALNKSNGTTPPPYIMDCIEKPYKNDPGNPTGLGGGGPSSGHHFWTSTWGIILIVVMSVLGLCLIAAIIFEIVKKRKLR